MIFQGEFIVASQHVLLRNAPRPAAMFIDLVGGGLLRAIVAFGAGRATPSSIGTKRVILVLKTVARAIGEGLEKRIAFGPHLAKPYVEMLAAKVLT